MINSEDAPKLTERCYDIYNIVTEGYESSAQVIIQTSEEKLVRIEITDKKAKDVSAEDVQLSCLYRIIRKPDIVAGYYRDLETRIVVDIACRVEEIISDNGEDILLIATGKSQEKCVYKHYFKCIDGEVYPTDTPNDLESNRERGERPIGMSNFSIERHQLRTGVDISSVDNVVLVPDKYFLEKFDKDILTMGECVIREDKVFIYQVGYKGDTRSLEYSFYLDGGRKIRAEIKTSEYVPPWMEEVSKKRILASSPYYSPETLEVLDGIPFIAPIFRGKKLFVSHRKHYYVKLEKLWVGMNEEELYRFLFQENIPDELLMEINLYRSI